MAKETLIIPDIGGTEDAEVIELCVQVGDRVEVEQSLIVLESDKASMDIPATAAGTVVEMLVKEGDTLAEGSAIVVLETEAAPELEREPEPVEDPASKAEEPAVAVAAQATAATAEPVEQQVSVPDIGTDDPVEVIEISVAVGDEVQEGDSLLVLESDKASMEIPAPSAGTVLALNVSEGAQVTQGDAIVTLLAVAVAAEPPTATPEIKKATPAATPTMAATEVTAPASAVVATLVTEDGSDNSPSVYAGPAVRKLAREFGVTLGSVAGSGPKGRILKEDLQGFVKRSLAGEGAPGVTGGGAGIPPIPSVDFSKFGAVDVQPLTRVEKLTAANMLRSWLNVPHVTQFDEVDITELENFRKDMKGEAERRGVKLTPLPFLLKACAAALRDNPRINASLADDGEHLVYKQYVHIGMAVDTPAGLLVPVIRDVDQKGLWDLAAETVELAQKAKERKLKPADMQGGCFTISSLGGIGGTGFTPIVNAPEAAILGVSKLVVKPVWDGSEFQPRKMLPLALSYDHRTVNGGDGGRFMTGLGSLLADIRRLLL